MDIPVLLLFSVDRKSFKYFNWNPANIWLFKVDSDAD